MKLTLLAVGRLRAAYREACDDYLRRLRRHYLLTEVEVREASRSSSADAGRNLEAASLRSRTPPGAYRVAVARGGAAWSSGALAEQVATWQLAARPVALYLGGSHGLAESLIADADATWSLGPLTLPHELARVVVLEQLYRAGTILRGEPYHKGRA